ncbi:hypothetical protein AUR66_00560 [Haloferax profundi]|uniref:Uncharacterized protein n=1 Tax=Haloferax profundi TaxID=1544718 RepID=A0A0W1SWL2_9EURY|nr:hypothetical protein AUR66_00560 [Haloferax profundi]
MSLMRLSHSGNWRCSMEHYGSLEAQRIILLPSRMPSSKHQQSLQTLLQVTRLTTLGCLYSFMSM